MKTKRDLFINNTLVQGICNYNCIICGINKPTYKGPKAYQTAKITKQLCQRVEKAIEHGIKINYIANSGDGEPTLHPEFNQRIKIFGNLIKRLEKKELPVPDIYVVTNGSNLIKPGILKSIMENKLGLIVSFPTNHAEHYGEIMIMDPKAGKSLLKRVIPGIEKAMKLVSQKKLRYIHFHISPPYHKYVYSHVLDTLNFLTKKANQNGLKELKFILFPSISNRTNLIKNISQKVTFHNDLFKKYHKKTINNIKINLQLMHKKFYSSWKEIYTVYKNFRFPCLVYANIFITVFGDSCCVNDQNLTSTHMNILNSSIKEIIEEKENYLPGIVCSKCNQNPLNLKGSLFPTIYRFLTTIKMKQNIIMNDYLYKRYKSENKKI